MKNLMTVLVIMLCGISYSQLTNTTAKEVAAIEYPSNIERYGVDYELVNYTFVNGDSTILNNLNLDELLLARKDEEDIVLTKIDSGLQILIYSRKRVSIKEVNTY